VLNLSHLCDLLLSKQLLPSVSVQRCSVQPVSGRWGSHGCRYCSEAYEAIILTLDVLCVDICFAYMLSYYTCVRLNGALCVPCVTGVAAISLVRMLVEEEPDEILSANSKAASPDVDQRTEAKLAFPRFVRVYDVAV